MKFEPMTFWLAGRYHAPRPSSDLFYYQQLEYVTFTPPFKCRPLFQRNSFQMSVCQPAGDASDLLHGLNHC